MGIFDGFRATGNNNSNSGNNDQRSGNNNSNQNNQNNQNDQNNNNNGNEGNNKQNPTDFTTGLWDNPNNENNNNQNNSNNNNNNQNNNNQNNNTAKGPTFDDYVNGLDFGMNFKAEDAEKLKNGDTSVLPGMFSEVAKSAYKRAMMDTNQLIASKMEEAVSKAVEKANGARNIDKLVTTMNSELEFTKDPLIAPVAKTILGRAITKGLSEENAVKAVAQYFKKTANAAQDLLDDNNGSGRMPGRNGFGGRSNNSDDTDFVALLTGQDG